MVCRWGDGVRAVRGPGLSDVISEAATMHALVWVIRIAALVLSAYALGLALLHLNTRGSRVLVARILGRPILVLPSAYLRWPINGVPRVRVPRIARVLANPRRPRTTAHDRFELAFRPGRTIEEARSRGATRRDVRAALRHGWIETEAA